MEVHFEDAGHFKPAYKRNNKRDGLKNLRCFPRCKPSGHSNGGFCGTPITITLKTSSAWSGTKLTCIGEFVVLGQPPRSARKKNDILSPSDMLEFERDKDNPKRAWLLGSTTSIGPGNETTIVFNKDRRGWHYEWPSKVNIRNMKHVFQVYVCKEVESGHKVLEVFQSPEFTVYCRSPRNNADAEAQLLASAAEDESENVAPELDGLLLAEAQDLPVVNERSEEFADSVPPPPTDMELDTLPDFEDADLLTLASSSMSYIWKSIPDIVADELFALNPNSSAKKRPSSNNAAGLGPNKRRRRSTKAATSSNRAPLHSSNEHESIANLQDLLRAVAYHVAHVDGFSGSDSASALDARTGKSSDPASPQSNKNTGSTHTKVVAKNRASSCASAPPNAEASPLAMPIARAFAKYMYYETAFTTNLAAVLMSKSRDPVRFRRFISLVTKFIDEFRLSLGVNDEEFKSLLKLPVVVESHGAAEEESSSSSQVSSRTSEDSVAHVGEKGRSRIRKDALARSRRWWGGGAEGAFDAITNELETRSALEEIIRSKLRDFEALSTRPLRRDPIAFTGIWEMQEDSGAEDMRVLRAEMGHPWLLRKLLEGMEKRFEIGVAMQNDDDPTKPAVVDRILVTMRRKLFSGGTMIMELSDKDSFNEQPWSLSLPVFQGLSLEWRYRAWLDDNGSVHHIHERGRNVRLSRVLTLDEDLAGFTIRCALEKRTDPLALAEDPMPDPRADRSKEVWEEQKVAIQRAKRVG